MSVDTLSSQVATGSRIFNRPFGKAVFRSGLMSQDRLNMQLGSSSDTENNSERRSDTPIVENTYERSRSKLNQNLTANDPVHKTTALRTFGLQSRISTKITTMNPEDSLRLNHVSDNMHQRSNMPSVSRTFGLISEDPTNLSLQNNERLNQELSRDNNVNSFIMPRSLGLQTRNITPSSYLHSQDNITLKQDLMNCRGSNMSAVSGTSGLNSGNLSSLNFHDHGNLNQSLKKNSYMFNLPARNLTLHSGVYTERNLRLNQLVNQRNNNMSKTFGLAVRNTALTSGFQEHDSMKYNCDTIDNDGFKRPYMPRIIRGRNSTLSTRLFHNQSTRHCQDLSNINGFNVSHISRRDMDTLSESRSALNMLSNCVDNQSICESVLSTASVKSQFLNLLENLHHSILNIGPHLSAEALRLEFDRAKQRLDNISEMSFIPSLNEVGPSSTINHSSKYICPPITESTVLSTVNEGSLHLKSSEDLLKMIVERRKNSKNKINASASLEEKERGKAPVIASSRNKEFNDEQDSDLLFKKPKPFIKKRKISQIIKPKTPQKVKSATSKATNKVINLRQWYPIAIGSNLVFCGIDEKGKSIKTEAVKKRISRRKVELISGHGCNLIGSPSVMVSFLPKKVTALLKNGLTDRWRVLQKELLNSQTAEEETQSRKSKSPKANSSPKKKIGKNVEEKTKIEKLKRPKVVSTPKKKDKEFHTRSGRTVKPPGMFWLLPGTAEVISSLAQNTSETTPIEISFERKTRKKNEETPVKKSKKITTPKANKKTLKKNIKASSFDLSKKGKKESKKSPSRKLKSPGNVSPRVKKADDDKSSKKLVQKQSKMKSPEKSRKMENEEAKVHSSTEDGKQQIKTRQTQSKRKRENPADSDSNQAKKSKLEKKTEAEVESTVNTPVITKKKNRTKKPGDSSKPKDVKSPSVQNKKKNQTKNSKKKTVSKNEIIEMSELEDDFELKLNDIEIPEIANVSGNLHLSRSQLRSMSMETPPLKYFNSNLKLLRSATPMRSPDWCISQRTESEVKRFQKRREEAFKKKKTVQLKKTVITEKIKNVQSRDVKRMVEWVAEKTVRSPQWNSKLLQYVIPSRRRMEQQDDEEEDEHLETEFL